MQLLGFLDDAGAVPQGESNRCDTGHAKAEPAVDVAQEHKDERKRVGAIAERGDQSVRATGGGCDIEAGLQGGRGLERSHIRSDEQADGENNDADDEAAEAVLVHDGGNKNKHVGGDGKVDQRNDLVTQGLKDNSEQQHDWYEDQGEGQGHGVADAHGGIKADVNLTAVGHVLLDESGSGVGNWEQALHQQGGHARDEHQDGTQGNAEDQNLGDGAGDVGGG